MIEPAETLARVHIYVTNRIAQARKVATSAPEESVTWTWGHIVTEELGAVLMVMEGDEP